MEIKLSATSSSNGAQKISGSLVLRNRSDRALMIQEPQNRFVLAFIVFDSLGNMVHPTGRGKVDPPFRTHDLPARSTFTHQFDGLDFLSGSAQFGYDLSAGNTYRIMAVYRPAGLHGPGFASQEAVLEIPK